MKTYSAFYYGFNVTRDNYTIILNDTLKAEVDIGSYTMTELANKVAQALNRVSDATFTCTVDRETRKFTISSDEVFSLTRSIDGASILWTLNIDDVVNVLTVESSASCGTSYEPQFWLQGYVPTRINKQAAFSTVNKSASGFVQVQKFGNESFMECEIKFITNIPQASVIKTNPQAVEEAIAFMDYLITKSPIEFMPDIDNKATFESFILESTEESSDGVGYKLKELYDKGLPNYYETGKLKFRKI